MLQLLSLLCFSFGRWTGHSERCGRLVSRGLDFLFTAIAILDIPFFSPVFTVLNRMMLIIMFAYLYGAAVSLAAAWLLSRWVYRMGPLSSLAAYRSRISGDKRA